MSHVRDLQTATVRALAPMCCVPVRWWQAARTNTLANLARGQHHKWMHLLIHFAIMDHCPIKEGGGDKWAWGGLGGLAWKAPPT
jgi:hypothetical protein